MQTPRIVVIGASAGGLEALRVIAAALPADLSASIAIVLHTASQSPGVLHEILSRAGPLRASIATDRARLEPGRIYVPPPDCHLVVEPGRVRVTKGPKENRFRPAIDPLFRSAAQVFGPAAIGVILTGTLDDGSAGLWAIKQLGGTAVVQDPRDALYPEMPQNAIGHVEVDHVVPLARVASLIVELVAASYPAADVETPTALKVEVNIAKEQNPVNAGLTALFQPSSYACPDCHGVLLAIPEGRAVRFRCHTGHAYSPDSLMAAVADGVNDALWHAIRALEEAGLLMHRMSDHYREHHGLDDAVRLQERAGEAHRQAEAIRELASKRDGAAETS